MVDEYAELVRDIERVKNYGHDYFDHWFSFRKREKSQDRTQHIYDGKANSFQPEDVYGKIAIKLFDDVSSFVAYSAML